MFEDTVHAETSVDLDGAVLMMDEEDGLTLIKITILDRPDVLDPDTTYQLTILKQ